MTFVPGSATYRGDVSLSILENPQITGPTTYGSFLVPAQATYDPATDLTTVKFRNATEEDYV